MVRKDYNKDGDIYYPDRGCIKAKTAGYFGTCLQSELYPDGCPFPKCLEDGDVPTPQQEEIAKRNSEIKHLSETGWTTEEISKQFHLSIRQAQKIISGESETGNSPYKIHRRRKDLPQRNEEIRRLRKGGATIEELSIKFKLCEKQIQAVCRD